jgi:diadenosine tetraphosphate (Ap4A) HIT family hydrolase
MKEDCEFCRENFSETVIKEYSHWQVQLFLNQYYLGRTMIKLKRHAVDLTELEKDEREELFEEVLPGIQEALDQLFDPDLYNQATLGNDCRHFHLHLIPRYSDDRKFNGVVFRDENWNSHYKPYPDDFTIEQKTFHKLRKRIEKELGQ